MAAVLFGGPSRGVAPSGQRPGGAVGESTYQNSRNRANRGGHPSRSVLGISPGTQFRSGLPAVIDAPGTGSRPWVDFQPVRPVLGLSRSDKATTDKGRASSGPSGSPCTGVPSMGNRQRNRGKIGELPSWDGRIWPLACSRGGALGRPETAERVPVFSSHRRL